MKKICIGVDEFTIVIFPTKRIAIEEWEFYAEQIIEDIFNVVQFEKVFDGKKSFMTDKLPAGYTVGYDTGPKDFYFSLAYNPDNPNMAVCLRFSAKAWAIYQVRYGSMYDNQITLPTLLMMIDNNMTETVRLSKVDFIADYFDYNINLDDLYLGLKSDEILVQNQDGRCCIRTINCFESARHVETIYVGSKKGNSRGFLRIYDKRIEQIATNGFRLNEAIKSKEWIRFEAVFKGAYAHKITDTILTENMDGDIFARFIASCITSKYRLYDVRVNEFLECTKKLIDLIEDANFDTMRLESPRDNSLRQNIQHIEHGSGFYPTIYKIEHLYGKTAVDEFLKYLTDQYHDGKWISRSMHAELTLWLKKHSDLKKMKLEDNY